MGAGKSGSLYTTSAGWNLSEGTTDSRHLRLVISSLARITFLEARNRYALGNFCSSNLIEEVDRLILGFVHGSEILCSLAGLIPLITCRGKLPQCNFS